MSTIIYALGEPDTREIRYIGKTVRIARRYRDHITESPKKKTHLGNWLRKVLSRGEKPVLTRLCEVPDELGSQAEMLFIKLARDGGMNLVNSTDGGEGITMTPEIRSKIGDKNRGRPNAMKGRRLSLSAAQREARGERQRGEKHYRFGKPQTDKERQVSGSGVKASWAVRLSTPEGRIAASEASKSVWTRRKSGMLPPMPPKAPSMTRSDTLKDAWRFRKLPYFSDGGGI